MLLLSKKDASGLGEYDELALTYVTLSFRCFMVIPGEVNNS